MRRPHSAGIRAGISCALLIWTGMGAQSVEAQGGDPAALEAYTRLAANHFGVPHSEVALLAEERILPDEVAVVLRIAQASGISPSVLVAFRRSGESWMTIARRYGMGGAAFHEAIPDGEVDDRTRRVAGLYRNTPATGWDALELTNDEVVALVNLRMLTRELGVSHARVLSARSETGSFMLALRVLAR